MSRWVWRPGGIASTLQRNRVPATRQKAVLPVTTGRAGFATVPMTVTPETVFLVRLARRMLVVSSSVSTTILSGPTLRVCGGAALVTGAATLEKLFRDADPVR